MPLYLTYYVLAGLFAWSLAEYCVHRFLLHRPSSRFWPEHRRHHQYPRDHVGVPYSQASGLALSSLFVGWLLFDGPGAAFAIGAIAGYAAYVTIHEGMHSWRIGRDHALYPLKVRHDIHHRGVRANYGVTSPFWDIMFGTYRSHRG